jgi:hypothetical protein
VGRGAKKQWPVASEWEAGEIAVIEKRQNKGNSLVVLVVLTIGML